MGNQKKNSQAILQWGIPTVVLVVLILSTLFTYRSNMLQEEKSDKIREYDSKVKEMADYYESEIYMVGQVARMLSTNVSPHFDYFCDANVDLLSSAVKQLNIQSAYLLRNDGIVMNDKGVEYSSIQEATGDVVIEDASDLQYITTKNGDCISYVAASFAEGYVILKCTPRGISTLDTYLSSIGKTTTYMLVSSTGVVIDSAGAEAKTFRRGTDIFSYLGAATYEKSSKESLFRGNLEQQIKGQVWVDTGEGAKYFIYEPIGKYHTSVMVAVDDKQISESAALSIKKTSDLVFAIGFYIFTFIAILVIISLFNATRYKMVNRELREQAERDLLTDLYNKIATETKIKEYLAGEGKNKKSLMFVLDIDNFKKINDTMGHAFGDEVLSTLGHQLKSEFRINDIIGRTGGDEFIIFLKDLKDDVILRKEAERVATFFKNFKVGEYTKYSATASIGAVEIPEDGADFETLYKNADKALYKAKKRGKNQMAFYKETKDDPDEVVTPVLKVVEEAPVEKLEVTDKDIERILNSPKVYEDEEVKEQEPEVINLSSFVVEEKKDEKPAVKEETISNFEAAVKEEAPKKKVVKKVVKKVPKQPVVTDEDPNVETIVTIIPGENGEPPKKVIKKVIKKKVVKKVPKTSENEPKDDESTKTVKAEAPKPVVKEEEQKVEAKEAPVLETMKEEAVEAKPEVAKEDDSYAALFGVVEDVEDTVENTEEAKAETEIKEDKPEEIVEEVKENPVEDVKDEPGEAEEKPKSIFSFMIDPE